MSNVIDKLDHDIKKGYLIHGKCLYGYFCLEYHESDNRDYLYSYCHRNLNAVLDCVHCKYFVKKQILKDEK